MTCQAKYGLRSSALSIVLCAAVSACGGGEVETASTPLAAKPVAPATGAAIVDGAVARSNSDIADDFVELVFRNEQGGTRQHLSRWDEPIRVSLANPSLGAYAPFLDSFLARLNDSAGVDIQRASYGEANLHIRMVEPEEMRRSLASAFCVVVPANAEWREFATSSDAARFRWSNKTALKEATVFIPADAVPFEVRLCLMEEITQALGPGNDMFRLADSIFNDDNAHSAPTSFDMLVLRTLYDERMQAGMSEAEARQTALAVLSDVNPVGATIASAEVDTDADSAWRRLMVLSFDRRFTLQERESFARQALVRAKSFPEGDHRLPFSRYRLALAVTDDRPQEAETMLRLAIDEYERMLGDDDIRVASARLYYAKQLNRRDDHAQALDELNAALPVLAAHESENRIAEALKEKHDALYGLGRDDEAIDAAILSLDWSLYALGPDFGDLAEIRAQLGRLKQ